LIKLAKEEAVLTILMHVKRSFSTCLFPKKKDKPEEGKKLAWRGRPAPDN